MVKISRSHRTTACLTTSRWPLVTGSNEPGYSAIRGINPVYPAPDGPASGPVLRQSLIGRLLFRLGRWTPPWDGGPPTPAFFHLPTRAETKLPQEETKFAT